MPRTPGVYPATPEFQALSTIFRSKLRAKAFLERHQALPWTEMERIARLEHSTNQTVRRQMKEQTASVSLVNVGNDWTELITTLKDLSKTGFPVRQNDAIAAGPDILRKIVVGPGSEVQLQLHAVRFSSHKYPLPWGLIDRKVLDTVYSIAALDRNRVVYLGSIFEYLYKWFGMRLSGGKERRLIEDALRRLISCQAHMELFSLEHNSEMLLPPTLLLEAGNLPLDTFKVAQEPDRPLPFKENNPYTYVPSSMYFVVVNEVIYNALIGEGPDNMRATWFPPEYLAQFSDGVHDYDFAKFVACRIHEARSAQEAPTIISLESINYQMGEPGKKNQDRWILDRAKQMTRIQGLWKGCSAYISGRNLVVWRLPDWARFNRKWKPYGGTLEDAQNLPTLETK